MRAPPEPSRDEQHPAESFAFVYNVLGGPVAAGLLYPVFGLLLNPLFASSVSVIANALRLRRVEL